MESSGAHNEPTRQLRFYCRDCEVVFDAIPDGTGYEQAPCPACREICLTVEFEREEQERNGNEAAFASLLGGLMGFGGIPHRRPARQSRRRTEAVTIARYETRKDAETDARTLDEKGIEATIVGEERGAVDAVAPTRLPPIGLQVQAPVAITAGQILRAMEPPELESTAPMLPEEDVVFPCEECGEILSFPGYRRGKVEDCPHCCEYVDVPE